MESKVEIAIVGGSGLTGTELIKVLLNHRYAELEYITSRTYKGRKVSDIYPGINCSLEFVENIDNHQLKKADVLFLCLSPHDSMKYLKTVIGDYRGMVIDVGSDFRLKDTGDYKIWYGEEHLLSQLLSRFVYGLPEVHREDIKGAKYIANPGCYPTSVLLGLYPLLDSGLADIDSLVIDSKSGVSGAGRKLKEPYLFISLNENFYAYSATGHRHIGEIRLERIVPSITSMPGSFPIFAISSSIR